MHTAPYKILGFPELRFLSHDATHPLCRHHLAFLMLPVGLEEPAHTSGYFCYYE